MIRFLPDTLRDALWRPVAMGAPDAGVYIETMAPDLRFGILLLLTVVALVALARRKPASKPLWVLTVFVWLAFVPWLATTGNGRYFMPILLLAGPACIAMVHALAVTRAFRIAAALLIVTAQGFVFLQANPWGSWSFAPWGHPYFEVNLSDAERTQPATYVTISSISYSVLAPLFDPRSHWINVASLHADPDNSLDDRRALAFLRESASRGLPMKLVVPTIPSHIDDQGRPNPVIRAEINRTLRQYEMEVPDDEPCAMRQSPTMQWITTGKTEAVKPALARKMGFWICRIRFPVARPPRTAAAAIPGRVEQAFGKLEQDCPRLFQRGEATSVRLSDGYLRTYPSSDTKAYVLDDGAVLYKYWRGLNPGRIGSIDEVLSDAFQMNCNSIRGRSGLPWERQL